MSTVKPSVVAILQARMSSTRLPGKVVRPLLGRPMIQWQIERVLRAKLVDRLVVATSTDPSEEPLVRAVEETGTAVVRGSLTDVLGRFGDVAHKFPADHYVRLTGDCPLSDPAIIDEVVALQLREKADYSSTCLELSFPDGLDAEVMSHPTLMRILKEATEPAHREHVTLYIRHFPQLFRTMNLRCERDLSNERWTVDNPEDFALIEKIVAHFQESGSSGFGWRQIEEFLNTRPELRHLNDRFRRHVIRPVETGMKR